MGTALPVGATGCKPNIAATSGRVDAGAGRLLAHEVDRPLHQPASCLSRDAELFADFAVAALTPVAQAEALFDRVASPGIEYPEEIGDHLLFGATDDHLFGARIGVGEQVDQLVGVVVTDGAIERGGRGQPMKACMLVIEFVTVAGNLAQCRTQTRRPIAGQANEAGLLVEGPADGLANPERGIRGELESLAPVELVDRVLEAQVAFLDEIE